MAESYNLETYQSYINNITLYTLTILQNSTTSYISHLCLTSEISQHEYYTPNSQDNKGKSRIFVDKKEVVTSTMIGTHEKRPTSV